MPRANRVTTAIVACDAVRDGNIKVLVIIRVRLHSIKLDARQIMQWMPSRDKTWCPSVQLSCSENGAKGTASFVHTTGSSTQPKTSKEGEEEGADLGRGSGKRGQLGMPICKMSLRCHSMACSHWPAHRCGFCSCEIVLVLNVWYCLWIVSQAVVAHKIGRAATASHVAI